MACEICGGTRWKSVTIDGVERLERCDCWRASVVDQLMADARVPTRYARAELANFEHGADSQREAYRRATKFVAAFPAVDKGLLLFGPNGVGKTHLAVGVLKEVIRTKGARGHFFETRELLRLVRDTYNRGGDETEKEVLAPVLDADLLVLDDLGAERTSEWVQETLGLVVNTRYNARRATIFTSNLMDLPDSTDPRGFVFQLGARTRSRLVEMCDWVEIRGADVREVGPHATPEDILRWQKQSPASEENVRRSGGLPPKTKGMARARLREGAPGFDLKWSGGKAGS